MKLMDLKSKTTAGGTLLKTERGWRLHVDGGSDKSYRLAQLDDCSVRWRSQFNWSPPLTFNVRARISASSIRGTWGFGLWNDPFGFACSPSTWLERLPALPQAIWFFAASPRSYLSLRDDSPANGFFAQAFRSSKIGGWFMASALALPFDRKEARRRLGRHIAEDAAQVRIDPCAWHDYELQWKTDSSEFRIDGRLLLDSEISPRAPLGIVIWIDNQYAAFDPYGGLAWGCESNAEAAWMDIEGLSCQHNAGAP